MVDELPSSDKVVYLFLEMIALGFALEAVSSFMHGVSWWKWLGALVLSILFLLLGIKSPQIKLKARTHLAHYLDTRPKVMVVLLLFSLYFVRTPFLLESVMNLHQRWQGWFGYLLFGLIGAILLTVYWRLTGAILRPIPQPASAAQPMATTQDDKPPTLLDLFKRDFSNTLRSSDNEDAISINWHDGAVTKIKRQVYMDFPAKTKFAGFYIPSPTPRSADISSEKAFTACLTLLENDSVQQAFDHVSESVAILAGRDGQMTSIKDLTFSGRVLIYHEEFLSIPQKADILRAYAIKNLDVQFVGSEYLGDQVIAWHRQRER
jgi:hypothetical protein